MIRLAKYFVKEYVNIFDVAIVYKDLFFSACFIFEIDSIHRKSNSENIVTISRYSCNENVFSVKILTKHIQVFRIGIILYYITLSFYDPLRHIFS